uniref:Uncharacterized protein n=1 Tax=Timema bartmani TaxID=61472 RepID=A0A7R9I5N8_9NEOP|nr:unnamed protein product [Timema bartmani]
MFVVGGGRVVLAVWTGWSLLGSFPSLSYYLGSTITVVPNPLHIADLLKPMIVHREPLNLSTPCEDTGIPCPRWIARLTRSFRDPRRWPNGLTIELEKLMADVEANKNSSHLDKTVCTVTLDLPGAVTRGALDLFLQRVLWETASDDSEQRPDDRVSVIRLKELLILTLLLWRHLVSVEGVGGKTSVCVGLRGVPHVAYPPGAYNANFDVS